MSFILEISFSWHHSIPTNFIERWSKCFNLVARLTQFRILFKSDVNLKEKTVANWVLTTKKSPWLRGNNNFWTDFFNFSMHVLAQKFEFYCLVPRVFISIDTRLCTSIAHYIWSLFFVDKSRNVQLEIHTKLLQQYVSKSYLIITIFTAWKSIRLFRPCWMRIHCNV